MRAYLVSMSDISHNLGEIRKKAGKAQVFAVLKGDGYGLGLNMMAKLCRDEGICNFAVTEVADVRRLRLEGKERESVLMLRPTSDPEEVRRLLEEDAILTIASQQNAMVASSVARELGVRAKAHVKIDTGMGRYGFLPENMEEILACYAHLDCLDLCGIYTHLHSAFLSKKKTQAQVETFLSVVEKIRATGRDPGLVHCANSSALFKNPDHALDAVRVGSAILGRLAFRTGLKKVGVAVASVDEIRWVPKGHTTGYGAAWKAKHPTRIAVIPVGWFHGFGVSYGEDTFRLRDNLRRIASALKSMVLPRRLTVSIGEQKCRVLGHVGMLHTVVDVTDKIVSLGDTATLEINPCRVRGMELRFRD